MEQDLISILNRIAVGIENLNKALSEVPVTITGDEIITAAEAANIIGVDPSTINHYKRTGKLTFTTMGCKDYFFKSKVMMLAQTKRKSS